MSPDVAIIPARTIGAPSPVSVSPRGSLRADASGRELRVSVVNDGQSAAENVVTLQLPAGWTATPPQQSMKFSRQDESQTVRFSIKAAPNTVPGEYHVHAIVSSGGQTFSRGYQTINTPHIRRQHIYHDADVTVKVINVKLASNLTVGYVMGVGDDVPAALDQLGVKVE